MTRMAEVPTPHAALAMLPCCSLLLMAMTSGTTATFRAKHPFCSTPISPRAALKGNPEAARGVDTTAVALIR